MKDPKVVEAVKRGLDFLAREQRRQGYWEASGGQICRRNTQDPPDRRRCVTYERVDRSHFRNSDGVGFCLGPCESDK